MSLVAQQFGGPSGPAGHLVTRMLARGNAGFNRWVVRELAGFLPAAATVIEVGSGPGVAVAEFARTLPNARIIGVDRSRVVHHSARRRNATAIADGRVILKEGNLDAAISFQPADLVLAVHVVYFWPDPVAELRRIHAALRPGGRVALGYQLRRNMPKPSQRQFPKAGFTLYDSDAEIVGLLADAGFNAPHVRIFGTTERPAGRLATAVA
jgi:SAM-dependent methyltransferase